MLLCWIVLCIFSAQALSTQLPLLDESKSYHLDSRLLPSALSPPSSVATVSVTPNTAFVQFDGVEEALYYQVYCILLENGGSSPEGPIILNAEETSTVLEELETGKSYKVWVVADFENGQSPPSTPSIFVVGAAECPTVGYGNALGPVTAFHIEASSRAEILSLIVLFDLDYPGLNYVEIYIGDIVCGGCQVSTDNLEDVECADVVDVSSACPDSSKNWHAIRWDVNVQDSSGDNPECGFDKFLTHDSTVVVYLGTVVSIANIMNIESAQNNGENRGRFLTAGGNGNGGNVYCEKHMTDVSVVFTAQIVNTLNPFEVYGGPLYIISIDSVINVMEGVHNLTIVALTQHPYQISSAIVGEENTLPFTYNMSVTEEGCEMVSYQFLPSHSNSHNDDVLVCSHVLEISSKTSLFPFPQCSGLIGYTLNVTMSCIDGQCPSSDDGDALSGGCKFSISTSFCPELLITASTFATLSTYRSVDTDPSTGVYMTQASEERSAFAYLNTIFYEMSISGLTGADVVVSQFEIMKQNDQGDSENMPSVSFAILNDGAVEEDATIPTVAILKPFGSDHQRDTIIFKHIVNEYTFPEYPTDLTTSVGNYIAVCTVLNNGFRRRIQSSQFYYNSDRNLFQSADPISARKTIGIGAIVSATDADITGDTATNQKFTQKEILLRILIPCVAVALLFWSLFMMKYCIRYQDPNKVAEEMASTFTSTFRSTYKGDSVQPIFERPRTANKGTNTRPSEIWLTDADENDQNYDNKNWAPELEFIQVPSSAY
mmetsp:Transcript_23753/g.30845  ORF Transcript_23753/g.30845 Transcript_23753/m.30845 type:complete len:772 (-) Transcript_23753:173-2488(-)